MGKYSRLGAGAAALALGSSAFAVGLDVSAATTGIGDASTGALAVIAAMTTFAVAVWGVKKIMRLFGR